MTEQQWLTCKVPARLLAFLRRTQRVKIAGRKYRLFACACCSKILNLLSDSRSREAIDIAERFAEGEAAVEELRAGCRAALVAAAACQEAEHRFLEQSADSVSGTDRESTGGDPEGGLPGGLLDEARRAQLARLGEAIQAIRSLRERVESPAYRAARAATYAALAAMLTARVSRGLGDVPHLVIQAVETLAGESKAGRREAAAQASLLRDLFPYQPVVLNPAWRKWNGGIVVRLARAIYEARRFEDLPVLADALEEAGCTNSAILSHCRKPGSHWRGCWVVDLVTSRE